MRVLASSGVQHMEFHVGSVLRHGAWHPSISLQAGGTIRRLEPEGDDLESARTRERALDMGGAWVRAWLRRNYPSFQIVAVVADPAERPSWAATAQRRRLTDRRARPRSSSR